MTRIVQIVPTIRPGSGVAGVAYALEREFAAAGATVERFTLHEAGKRPRRSTGRTTIGNHLEGARNVVWFSTIGTRRARRFLAQRPDAVSICHNDVLAGDVYVNHGLLQAAMRARGNYAWRMVRNPVHLFTAIRDRIRYRSRTHRAIVALTSAEAELLVETYGRVRAPIHVIPNGVDVERFRPPDAAERSQARSALGIDDERTVAVFVGHEYERKGLPLVIEGLRRAAGVTLVVVGGSPDMIRHAESEARELGVAGFAPDLVRDGENGHLVDRDAASVGDRLDQLDRSDLTALRAAARATAEQYSWREIARRYLELVESLRAERERRA